MVPFLAQDTRQWPHGIPGGKYFWLLLHYGHYISRDIFLVHNNFIDKFCEPAICHHQVAWLVLLLSPGILHTPFGGLDFCLYRVACRWLWSFSVSNSFTTRRVSLQIKTRHRNEHFSGFCSFYVYWQNRAWSQREFYVLIILFSNPK